MDIVLALVGFLNVGYPENGVVRNFVRPGEWRANPSRAAAKQRRQARLVGVGFVALGLVLLGVGVLA